MFPWFLRWRKSSAPPLQLRCVSKIENSRTQKLTLHHSYLSKWQNSKSSEFLNISNVLFWLRYNQSEVLLFWLQRFFCSAITLDDLINSERNFSYLRSEFPQGQNYANLCQNPAINLNIKVISKRKFENLPRGLPPKHTETLPTKSAQMLTSLVKW